ncbi:unnamed protein product [[Candida] boidinii]|nr:unnamed protein product [[Candida] boidinii]
MPPKFVSSGSINVNDLSQEKEQVRKLNERYLYNRNKNERRSLINQLHENRVKKYYENKKKWESQNSAYRLNYKDALYYNQLNQEKDEKLLEARAKDMKEIEIFKKLKEGSEGDMKEANEGNEGNEGKEGEVREVSEEPIVIKKRKIKGIVKKKANTETENKDKKDQVNDSVGNDKLKLLEGYSSEDE